METTSPVSKSLRANLRWGAGWGLLLGCLAVVWVSISYITGASADIENRPAWGVLSAVYILAGLLCGLVVGVVRPLLTSFLRSVLLGPVIALPFYLTIDAALGESFLNWDALDWVIFAIPVIVVGTVAGRYLPEDFRAKWGAAGTLCIPKQEWRQYYERSIFQSTLISSRSESRTEQYFVTASSTARSA